MNDPEEPTWGSWAGRYGRNNNFKDRPYYWANVEDEWQSSRHRDNTLKRWAVHIQNDLRARLDWCVNDVDDANHPPMPVVKGTLRRSAATGDTVVLDASDSSDPDGDELHYEWEVYPEVGSYQRPAAELRDPEAARASLIAPTVDSQQTIHLLLTVTDQGIPPLSRYARVIVTVDPQTAR
jgi:hypothetical protein